MFEVVRKFLDSISFEDLDHRKVRTSGRSGGISLRLRGNQKTGERYALLEVGAEGAIHLSAKELADLIRSAQAIYDQMR